MFSLKRLSFLVVTAVIMVSSVWAQSNSQNKEMSVEESYLQQSIEVMIIRETARAHSREQKMIALEYVRDAIERGNTSDEIRQTLDFLSREGRRNLARENGRLVNNYPDVRRQSAKYLGQIGTEEAKDSLLEIIKFENEPSVLQEAIKSLGDIGLNDNDETVKGIAFVMRKNYLNPDDLMALATIHAFERIARNNDGIKSPEAVETLVYISGENYSSPVRERARQLLAELRTYGNR